MSELRGEKRPLVQQNSILEGIAAIVIDLEGVSTPNSYINEGFVSHVKENLKKFLEEHYDDDGVKSSIESLRKSNGKIPEASDKKAVVSAVFDLVTSGLGSEDVLPELLHSPLLEAFWTEAYKEEDIQGDLYEDVVPLIKVLTSNEVKVVSYSCSSVALQKLFYANSNQGDVSQLYSDFLVRKKPRNGGSELANEVKLLVKENLKLGLNDVLYITHSLEASKAAGEIGMKSCFVLRDVADDITEEQLQSVHVISNLDELTEDDFDDDDDDDDDLPPSKRGRLDDGDDDDDDGDDNEDDEDGEEEEEEEEE